jgi:hypothetical protein
VGHLSGHRLKTLRRIFSHPLEHNLEWDDVVNLVRDLGSVEERHNGEVSFTLGTVGVLFRRPHGKDIAGEDVIRLRKLFADAGFSADGDAAESAAETAVDGRSPTIVVAADHHVSRVFELGRDGEHMQEITHVSPADPDGFRRHLEHKKEADYKGERIPEDSAYYERIATALKPAQRILLIGDATGKSSATAYLLECLEKRHAEIFRCVSGTVVADLSALTDGQLEAIARNFFAEPISS